MQVLLQLPLRELIEENRLVSVDLNFGGNFEGVVVELVHSFGC